ncbi:MAG TPA: hypothetical protein VFK47_23910, partial [Ktedonobacteraceae bacterium]|nr:hypothetical protein [Ktedonobacteraceae bacterium]
NKNNLVDGLRNRWAALAAIGATVGALAAPMIDQERAFADSAQVTIGMPFAGKWGWNVHKSPPYTDDNSSHPSVHAAYGSDWATDLYPGDNKNVKLYGTSSQGTVTFKRSATTDTCASAGANIAGRGVIFDVRVNGVKIGKVKYDHLDLTDVGDDPVVSGTKIGTVTTEPLDDSCFQIRHTHVELTNDIHYACYTDKGDVGATVAEEEAIGIIGSPNLAGKQACSDEPASTPPPPPPDTDHDGYPDTTDQCPYAPGTAYGCPDADYDMTRDSDDVWPTQWGPSNNRGVSLSLHTVSGDFNGDGRGDVMAMYNYHNGIAKLWQLAGASGQLLDPLLRWDSGGPQTW